jgi:uncharacterized protein (DUF305 family)
MRLKRPSALAAVAVAGALVLTACGGGGTGGAEARPSAEPATASAPASAAADFNDADVMFAQMMVPHHAQAIEMSDVVLGKEGVDPEVDALAQRIKDAQGPEIAQMTGWLQQWGQPAPHTDGASMGGMDHGGGMMGADDMQALSDADGPEVSRLFLEQMVEHHRGAIEMAEAEVADGQNPDAVALARAIVDAQQAEIEEMQGLLGSE